jgi:hypothetical protein
VTFVWWAVVALAAGAAVLWVLYCRERTLRVTAVRLERWQLTDFARRVADAEPGAEVAFPPGWSGSEAQRFAHAVLDIRGRAAREEQEA